MKIAQVAPLYESVPPQLYGGTERVVSWLTEELVRQGHDVTLFASGDSVTKAQLVAPVPKALRLDVDCLDQLALHLLLLEEVFRRQGAYDVVHFHCDYLHFPFSRRQRQPHVTTLHGRLDLPELPRLYREYEGEPVVSISDAQRLPLPGLNWRGTVHHGMPRDLHTFRGAPGRYLAFLGRISPEKRVDRAIAIARAAGMPLKVAAKIDRADRDYFKEQIEPLLKESAPLVDFVGEVGGRAKDEFLGNAAALLFPIDWPEPFGLVMIEALACGTPVIAFRRGSVPEIMDDGATGFVVDDVQEAVRAVGRLGELRRGRCRQVFEERFSVERMACDYLAVYRGIAEHAAPANGKKGGHPSAAAGVLAVSPGVKAERRAPRPGGPRGGVVTP